MCRTQPSGTAGRTNRGFLAQCPPNPHGYPSHKTTRPSPRRCVLPQPAQATAIRGSPFLFLPTVEFLVYDSAYQFRNGKTLFPWQSFPRPLFAVSKDRCLFVRIPCRITYTNRSGIVRTVFNGLRLAYPALKVSGTVDSISDHLRGNSAAGKALEGRTSFVAERDDGIDAGGAAGGEVASGDRYKPQ